MKKVKGFEEASKYLDGFYKASEFKEKIIASPYKTSLIMNAVVNFSGVNPIEIDTEEIILELGQELMRSDYLAYLATQMHYSLLTIYFFLNLFQKNRKN
ncbi:hypothetical protein ACIFOE_03750 [Paenibacillus sp. NRS-1783]|uniref:hypothetical protein n=1 Tax=Paenibacillus sp. NRS-1783 TaxID=3233907 RepID=UPI003D2D35B0